MNTAGVSNRAEMTRQKLLAASRQVAFEDGGAAGLTIDAVARAAGVSKGAVLYHFASKDQLLAAVLDSLFDGFDASIESEARRGIGWLRAYLRASFPDDRAGYLRETQAIFAILSLRPELRAVARQRFLRWHEQAMSDGQDPVTASLIRAAIDGLWYNEMFGFSLEDQQRRALLQKIEALLDAAVEARDAGSAIERRRS